jgi:hypothetical protein
MGDTAVVVVVVVVVSVVTVRNPGGEGMTRTMDDIFSITLTANRMTADSEITMMMMITKMAIVTILTIVVVAARLLVGVVGSMHDSSVIHHPPQIRMTMTIIGLRQWMSHTVVT